ncbi:MAG: TonB-dependent receptor, partial [Saprospiraceae bacterium]
FIKENEVSNLDVALEQASVAMNEVVITYTIQKSSSVAQLVERRNAAVVSDGISSELIRKTPDRNASDALKRVTGASIQEGKFAIIRGMNDRYNSGYLDGAILPSTESDRKAFAFDVIPANLIDNLQIIKAGSPELAGDFGGGIIKINTKAIPDKLTQQISIGGQMHSLTTNKSINTFQKYSGENINFINSKRDLPNLEEKEMKTISLFPTEQEKIRLAANSKLFNLDWVNETHKISPNTRLAYSLGCPFDFGNDQKLGLVFAINYANTKKLTYSSISSFDGAGQVSKLNDEALNDNISTGGILNINYNSHKTQISLRNFVNINSDFNTINRSGIANISDYIEVKNMVNLVSSNRLTNSIATIKRIIGSNFMTLQASVNYGNVNRQIPTYKIASYTKTPDNSNFNLSLGDFFNSSTGLFNSALNENLTAGSVDLIKKFDTNKFNAELKIGYGINNRNREFKSRNFVYAGNQSELMYNPEFDLAKDKISPYGLYLIEKTSNDLAYYNGKQSINSTYLSVDQRIFKNLRALYGVRYENADIHVFNEKVNMEISKIKKGSILPSLNLTYVISQNINLRAAYFASLNRPEFRELAPFSFYSFDKNAEIRGNSNLKIATLNNFELRAEWFPTGAQVISAGAFLKNIRNPVEFNIDITQTFTTFTFNNEKSAKIYGLEFEIRKNLDFIGSQNVYKEFTVFGNLALIKSKLEFEEGTKAFIGRPLQGQSPYVINAGFQFEREGTGWATSIVLNRVGRRIAYVGVDPKYGDTRQDIYESPRTVIDLQISKTFKNLNLKFTLGDLLKNDLNFYQDVNHSGRFESEIDRNIFQFKNGITSSLSLNYSF